MDLGRTETTFCRLGLVHTVLDRNIAFCRFGRCGILMGFRAYAEGA